MKLFHITRNKDICFLKPMIPVDVLDNEDTTVPRISFSDSIDNCFKSVSWNRHYYKEWKNNMFSNEEAACITVFELDTDSLVGGIIIPPNDVRYKYGVDDAKALQKYWVVGVDRLNIKRYTILPTTISEYNIIITSKNTDCSTCFYKDCEDCVEELTRYSIDKYIIKK